MSVPIAPQTRKTPIGYDMTAAAGMLAILKALDYKTRLATLAVVCKILIEGRLEDHGNPRSD